MFKSKPKVLIPTEKSTHTHHHYSPAPWPDHVFPALWRLLGLLSIFAGVSWLSRENHHPHPTQNGVYAVLIIVVVYVLWPKIERALDRYLQYRLEAQELLLKYEYTPRSYTLPLTDPTQAKLLQLCEAVLGMAYLHLHDHGPYKKGEGRPWSKRNAGSIVLTNDGDRQIGEHLGAQVRGILIKHNIISGPPGFDQLNVRRYPGISQALAELKRP